MPGKRIQLDDDTWIAVRELCRDRMSSFQELTDEAFADLLRKHKRPVGFRDSLKASVARAEKATCPRRGRTVASTKRTAAGR